MKDFDIKNINIRLKDNSQVKDNETLAKLIEERIAQATILSENHKNIEQLYLEQQNQTQTSEHISTSTEGGATTATHPSALSTAVVSTTPSVSMGNNSTVNLPQDTSQESQISTATQHNSSIENPSENPSAGSKNNATNNDGTLTGSAYYPQLNQQETVNIASSASNSVSGSQAINISGKLKANEENPTSIDRKIKKEIQKKINFAKKNKDEKSLKYWLNLKDSFKTNSKIENYLFNNTDDPFTKLYYELHPFTFKKNNTIKQTKTYNLDWDFMKKNIATRLNDLYENEEDDNKRRYYKKFIHEITISRDIQKLFDKHDELFVILKSLIPDISNEIIVYTNKQIYPNLSPKKVYPKDIGIDYIYNIWAGTLLDEVKVNYTKGELTINKDGKYKNLELGQWYDYDRIDNPTKKDSTFWKAALYNTEKGNHFYYNTIAQRHAYYLFADAYLKEKGIISEWFDAAARVTMGSLLEQINGETALGAAEGLNLWYLSDKTESFLKEGNRYLFQDNMENVRLLLEEKGRLSGQFTDAKGKIQTFKNLSKQELDYKLVEFEQSLVQEYINSSFNNLNNSFIKRSLNEFITSTENDENDEIIKQINNNFSHWMSPDIMQDIMEENFIKEGKLTFNFANYNDRVKLGQLMVKKLYYLRERDVFISKTNEIILNPTKYALKPNQKPFKPSKKVTEKELRIKDILAEIRLNAKRIITIYKNIEKFKKGYENGEYQELKRVVEFVKKELEEAIQEYLNQINQLKQAIKRYINKVKKYLENPEELISDIEKYVLILVENFNQEFKKQMEEFYKEIKELPQNIYSEFKVQINELNKNLEELPKYFEDFEKSIEQVKEGILNSYDNLTEYVDNPQKIKEDTYNLYEKTKDNIGKYAEKKSQILNPPLVEYLTKTAVAIYPDLMNQIKDKKNKVNLLKTNYKATVAILLYEFANGTDQPIRKFNYKEDAFANKILEGRVIKEIMKEAVEILERDNYDFKNLPNSDTYLLSLDFSPSFSPKSWLESADKHLDSNLAQFFLGGSLAYFYIENKKMIGFIENKTSRNSLMLHSGNNYKGENINLATITQKIYFTFDLNKNSL